MSLHQMLLLVVIVLLLTVSEGRLRAYTPEEARLLHPTFTTIVVHDGELVGCVDVMEQPAFSHPLLKNHTIQMRPSFLPEGASPSDSGSTVVGVSNVLDCPSGTIPVRMKNLNDLSGRTKSYNGTANDATAGIHLHQPTTTFPGSLTVAMQMVNRPDVFYTGVSGGFSTWNFTVGERQSSTAQLWVEGDSTDQFSSLQTGWIISPQVYGDSSARFFVYWTADGYRKTGCYDLKCAGFVQVHRGALLGGKLPRVSSLNGSSFEIKPEIFQDPKTKDWWLYLSGTNGDVPIGYWPAELFPSLAPGARHVSWGGRATGNPDGTFPAMGSSSFSEPHNYGTSCYFSNMEYNDGSPRRIPGTDNTKQIVDGSNCYGLRYFGNEGAQWGSIFTFGGPAGKCL